MNGLGAAKKSGRWNPKGVPLVYCSESRAMCVLEVIANSTSKHFPKMRMVTIEFPNEVAEMTGDLSDNWADETAGASSRKIGADFISEKKHLAMRVPSSLVPGDFNIVINPLHPSISKAQIIDAVDFKFGKRLI
jgi:RES domain-containing protein